jgi:hypothetical protein
MWKTAGTDAADGGTEQRKQDRGKAEKTTGRLDIQAIALKLGVKPGQTHSK